MTRAPLAALRTFETVARHGSFRAAADVLCVTQGAVAQSMRKLEADLGVELFVRHARGVRLTERGADYASSIGAALTAIDAATDRLLGTPEVVTLSVPPSLAAKWLVARLGRLVEAHPRLDVRVLASEDVADFRSDGVDVAVRQAASRPESDAFVVERLCDLDLVAVGSRSRAPVRFPADLVDQPLLEDAHHYWSLVFGDDVVTRARRVMHFSHTALAVDAAANGQGIALAPRLLVNDDLASGRLVALWRDDERRPGGFFTVRPRHADRAPVADLVRWMSVEAREVEVREVDGPGARQGAG